VIRELSQRVCLVALVLVLTGAVPLRSQSQNLPSIWRLDDVTSLRENGLRGEVILNGFWMQVGEDVTDLSTGKKVRVPGFSSGQTPRRLVRRFQAPDAWRDREWFLDIHRLRGEIRLNGRELYQAQGKPYQIPISRRLRAGDEWLLVHHKYDYLKQLAWTYGRKPKITAAAGRNLDGSWVLGISNHTLEPEMIGTGKFNRDNAGHPSERFEVTLQVDELAGAGTLPFQIERSDAEYVNRDAGSLVMENGRVTVTVDPLELVTPRSTQVVHL